MSKRGFCLKTTENSQGLDMSVGTDTLISSETGKYSLCHF